MAASKSKSKTTLVIPVLTKVVEGKEVYTNSRFNGVKEDATVDNIVAVGVAIQGLLNKTQTMSLIEEYTLITG